MSVPWWLQTTLSALRNQNQTRIKMNKHPHPQSQESSKKECRKSYRAHWSQGHSKALLIGRCLQLCYLSPAPIWCLWPDRNPDTAKLPTNLCLNTTSFSFISFSRIRVCFLHERSAVRDCWEGLTPSFLNTDFTSLKASLRTPTQCGGGREGSLDGAVLKTEGKKKTKPNHPSSSFLKQREKLRDGIASGECPS